MNKVTENSRLIINSDARVVPKMDGILLALEFHVSVDTALACRLHYLTISARTYVARALQRLTRNLSAL